MKNKLVKLLILVLVISTPLVGCSVKKVGEALITDNVQKNVNKDNDGELNGKPNEVVQGVADFTDEDIDTENVIPKADDIEGIAALGEFKPSEFISRRNEKSNEDGYFTEYYSSANFDEVVGYYKAKFKNVNNFDITEYPNSYVQMSGFVGDIFLQFDIQKEEDEDEDEKKTYIVYQYEPPTEISENNPSNASSNGEDGEHDEHNEESGLTAEEFEHNIDECIDDFIGNDDIRIRKEIGKLDYQEWKEEWDVWYPKNLTVKIEGGGLSYDFTDGPNNSHDDGEEFYDIEYNCYFKGDDSNILAIYKGKTTKTVRIIYDGDLDVTTIIGEKGYKISENGNSAPLRLLDLSYFEAFEGAHQDHQVLKDMGIEILSEDQFITKYIEKENGDRFMVGSYYYRGDRVYTQATFVYSFDLRIIIAYQEIGTELEYCNHNMDGKPMVHSVGWKVTKYDDTTILDKKLLEQNNYKGEYINVEE